MSKKSTPTKARPKGNKGVQPKMRFPEFKEPWNVPSLGDISDRIVKKVGSLPLETVSISAGIGFVTQASKFSRDISGEQYKNYIVLNEGEFSYNKGNSKKFPQGCVYKLKNFSQVAAPNVFISFKIKENYISDFYQGYFDNNFHGEQLKKFITSGARSNGLLNISADDFFSIKLPTPIDKAEQQKIANCLSSIDSLIELEVHKLDALKDHKAGLMQQLFPPEGKAFPQYRFSEFRNAPEWKEKPISAIGDIITGSTPKTNQLYYYGGKRQFVSPADMGDNRYIETTKTTLSNEGFAETRPVKENSILFVCIGSTIGKIAQNKEECATNQQINSIVPRAGYSNSFVYFILEWHANRIAEIAGNQAVPIINKSTFGAVQIRIPKLPEQQRIAECLSSVSDLITTQSQKLAALRDHKRGLMQQLFPSPKEVAG